MTKCNYYPKFEKNQVLTAEQLNQMINYLDKQERLTRNKLIGVGIICGFDLELVKSPNVAVKISEGCGITTEGYLVALNKFRSEKLVSNWHTFTKYRPYKDPSKYSLFGDGTTQLNLWELLYDDFIDENSAIEKLSLNFLKDKAVILFLEKKEVDLATCTGNDCNEKGIRVELCVRALLIDLKDLAVILKKCSQSVISKSYSDEIEGKFDLPVLSVNREYSLSAGHDYYDYTDLINLYAQIFDECLIEYPDIFSKTYELFSPLLVDEYPSNPFKSLPLYNVVKNFLNQNPYGFQYVYDFIKDLTATYNEFRDTVFDLTAACSYDAACFPHHLMLGEAVPSEKCRPSVYRNTFSLSPVYNSQKDKRDKSVMIFKRLVAMIKTFELPENELSEIKITPSKEFVELGERAIPYYYVSKEFVLNPVWNYDLKRKCRPYNNLSYYAEYYPKNSTPDYIVNPLRHNINNFNFFRIEGYLGMKCGVVMESLLSYIAKYNLPIKIVKLILDKDLGVDTDLPDCRFQDLELLYITLRTEFFCFLQSELKFFGQLDYGYSEKVTTTYGGLKVTVVESQKESVLQGATIALTSKGSSSQSLGGVSNSSGVYLFKKIPTGSYTLKVSYFGYQEYSEIITIEEAKSKIITVTLQPADTKTPPKEEYTYGVFEFGFGAGSGSKYKGDFLESGLRYDYKDMSVGSIYKGLIGSSTRDIMGYLDGLGLSSSGKGDIVTKYYYPLQIVDLIDDIAGAVPQEMNDFDFKYLSGKTDSLSDIIDTFKDQITTNLKDESYQPTGTESEILVHLDELKNMCTLQNFKKIVQIYKARALEIQKLTLFNNYVKEHPGVEHRAGVPRGGTFIIVCDVENNVVADFCLPYICCSDCPPITYVIADQPVIFKLSKSTFCVEDDSEYVIITEPAGGTVTGAGVTQDPNTGQYFFNPSKAGVGQIKLVYNYNLNDYELLVTVAEVKPIFTVALGEPKPGTGTRDVSFAALPDGADSYEWDFGDESGTSSEQKPVYTYDVSEKQKFTVTLIVKKGECSGTTSQTITVPTCSAVFTYKIEKVVDNIAVVQFDSEMKEGESYEWDFGDGKTFSGEDPLHSFDISEINSFTVTLKVAKGDCSDSSDQEITITPCTAEFNIDKIKTTYNQTDFLFVCKTTDADSYSWDFGDGSNSGSVNSSQIKHSYLLKSEEQTVTVTLVMKKGICTATVVNKITLPKSQDVSIGLKYDEYCKKEDGEYKFELSVAGGVVSGKGVVLKDDGYYFIPSNSDVQAGTITFTYKLPDGTTAEFSVKVYNPVASFKVINITPSGSSTQQSYVVYVENSSSNAETFVWTLNSVVVSKEVSPKIVVSNTEPGAQYELILTATMQKCSDTTKQIIQIPSTPVNVDDNVDPVTSGGDTFIFVPAGSGTVEVDQPVIAFNTNNTTIKDFTANSMFGGIISANEPSFADTQKYFQTVTEELSNLTMKRLYMDGNKNDEMAEQFGHLFNETANLIVNYSGADAAKQKQFAYNLIMLQTSQLFNLLNLQQKDIATDSAIAGVFAMLYKQFVALKGNGVDLNPGGKFGGMLKAVVNISADKPLLLTYVEKITKVVVD